MARVYEACQSENGFSFGGWSDAGSALGEDALRDILDVSGPGRALYVRTHSDNGGLCAYCRLDADDINYGEESPDRFIDIFGCCGDSGLSALSKYDTVNNKYVMQWLLHRLPQDFNSEFKVWIKNYPGGATSIKSASIIVYTIDTSLHVVAHDLRVDPHELRAALAGELGVEKGLLTVVAQSKADKITKVCRDEMLIAVHSEEAEMQEAVIAAVKKLLEVDQLTIKRR